MIKNFVLDTNVLISDPECIFKFHDNNVFIPIYVLEEVDKFKTESSERGRSCRQVGRILDELRTFGSLSSGVQLGEGLGILRIHIPLDYEKYLNSGTSMDNSILAAVLDITKSCGDESKSFGFVSYMLDAGIEHDGPVQTILVTLDVNLRVRANALGIVSQTYENSKSKIDIKSSVIEVESDDQTVNDFFSDKVITHSDKSLHVNSSVVLKSQNNSALCRYSDNKLNKLKVPRDGVMGIKPKNKEQAFALDLLLDDSIQLVTLIGKAGTGKTLLALAAAMKAIEEGIYTKLLVSRPVMPMGRDIGFLPGEISEKMQPWMQPIFDNMEVICGKKENKLMKDGLVQVEPITYIRGRSLPNVFLIVDECQNTTQHEIKTILSRAGHGSKIVLCGDPEQIDLPYVDELSNGISHVSDKFRGQKIFGSVILTKGERSQLAELSTTLL